MNENLKRYIVSSIITFVSVFCSTFGSSVALLGADEVASSVIWGMVLASTGTALRAVVKGLYESTRK